MEWFSPNITGLLSPTPPSPSTPWPGLLNWITQYSRCYVSYLSLEILPKPCSVTLSVWIQSCVCMFAALIQGLGLTEMKNRELKRTKCQEDKSSYIRAWDDSERETSSGRQKGRRKRKPEIFIFTFLLVSVIIDGFPVTKYQMSLLEARSIIPMVIFELDVPSKEIFKRLLLEKKKEQR